MKKFSIIAVFIFAFMISSSVLAADWVKIHSEDTEDFKLSCYVDKNSIRHGINAKKYNFSRSDGFTVLTKDEVKTKKPDPVIMYWLTGFFEENGKIKYCILDIQDENRHSYMKDVKNITISDAEETGSESWLFIYNYVKKNLL